MKNTIIAAVLALAAPAAARAQEDARAPALSATITADLVSTYLLRGINVTDAPTLQPSATLSHAPTGLSVGVWASYAVTGRDGNVPFSTRITRRMVDEVDYWATLTRTAGAVSLAAGYIAYVFPDEHLDFMTQEVYGSVGLPSAPFAPTLTVYYDFDDGMLEEADSFRGLYVTLGTAHSVDAGVPLDLAALLAWTDVEGMRPRPGLNDLSLSVGSPIPVGPLTLTPALTYTHVFPNTVYGHDSVDAIWASLEIKLER